MEGWTAGPRPLLASRLLGLPSFWAPMLEGDRGSDFCLLGGWLGHRCLQEEPSLREPRGGDQGGVHSRGQRLFSSEAPGDVAMPILPLSVLTGDLHHAVLGLDLQLLGGEAVDIQGHPPAVAVCGIWETPLRSCGQSAWL